MLGPLLLSLALHQTDSLTLAQALARAQQHRPQLTVARSLAAEARARLGIAGTIPNPVLQYKHTQSSPTEEATLEQRSDWLFARWAERRAARAAVQGAEADSTQIAADVSREVRVAFFGALAADETLRLSRALGASADSLARFAAERVAAGDLSALEREQFEVEAGRVRQLVSRAEEGSQVSRAALAKAVGGVGLGDPIPVGSLAEGLDAPWPGRSADETLPFLTRALTDSAAESGLASAAKVRRYPLPSLIVGREWDDGSPFSAGATGIIGFTVPVPLWNFGGGAVRLARARAERAAAAAGEARLEARRLLAAGEARLRAARDRALMTRDSLLPRSERLRAGAVRLYRAGQTGVLPLFDALRADREIALGYLQDLLAWQIALADWLSLLGRAS